MEEGAAHPPGPIDLLQLRFRLDSPHHLVDRHAALEDTDPYEGVLHPRRRITLLVASDARMSDSERLAQLALAESEAAPHGANELSGHARPPCSPATRRLGRRLRGFVSIIWRAHRLSIVRSLSVRPVRIAPVTCPVSLRRPIDGRRLATGAGRRHPVK